MNWILKLPDNFTVLWKQLFYITIVQTMFSRYLKYYIWYIIWNVFGFNDSISDIPLINSLKHYVRVFFFKVLTYGETLNVQTALTFIYVCKRNVSVLFMSLLFYFLNFIRLFNSDWRWFVGVTLFSHSRYDDCVIRVCLKPVWLYLIVVWLFCIPK